MLKACHCLVFNAIPIYVFFNQFNPNFFNVAKSSLSKLDQIYFLYKYITNIWIKINFFIKYFLNSFKSTLTILLDSI